MPGPQRETFEALPAALLHRVRELLWNSIELSCLLAEEKLLANQKFLAYVAGDLLRIEEP